MLVNDNSACCENGHTSVTDINDVHCGCKGRSQWKAFLDEYSAGVFPGSRWKISDGGTQNGQPWLMGETTLYRGGHDRGPMFLDHNRRLRGADYANTDDAVAIDSEATVSVDPGARLSLPVKLSHFSDHDLTNATLRWKVAGSDVNGTWTDPGVGGSRAVAPARYAVTDAGTVTVDVPRQLRTGHLWVWLETPGGQTVAENQVTFDDRSDIAAAFDPTRPTSQQWTGGSKMETAQGIGYGRGYFDYTASVPAAAQNGGTLTFEASSAEPLRPDPVRPRMLPATGPRKYPTELTVTVDGTRVHTVTLPDDPWDPLGLAARAHGLYGFGLGNHYGYRVAVPLPAAILNGKTTVSVRLESNGGGLMVFGQHAGANGVPPRIVTEPVSEDVPRPVPTVTDRPSVSVTPIVLDDMKAGVAIVTVVNDTDRAVTDVEARLDLPPGWRVTPAGRSRIDRLEPAQFVHVPFEVRTDAALSTTASAEATALWTDSTGKHVVQVPATAKTRPQNPAPASPVLVSRHVGDIDGDGKPDILGFEAPSGDRLWFYPNSSTPGNPGIGQRVHISDGWQTVSDLMLADWDADGKLDIIGRVGNGDELKIWLNTSTPGRPSFKFPAISLGVGWNTVNRIVPVDLTGDGKVDLATWSTVGQPSRGTSFYVSSGWRNVHNFLLADYDGDGKVDILGRAFDDLYVWRNTGANGRVSIEPMFHLGNGWNTIGKTMLFDATDDGKPDITGYDPSAEQLWVTPNTSTPGNPTRGHSYRVSDGWRTVHTQMLGDWDGDGKVDIIGRTFENMAVWRNTSADGRASFAPPAYLGSGWGSIGRYVTSQ